MDPGLDPKVSQFFPRTYTREFEQLWCIEGTCRKDHFFFDQYPFYRWHMGILVGIWVGPVKMFALKILNTHSRIVFTKKDFCRQCVCFDGEIIWEGFLYSTKIFTRTRSLPYVGCDRGKPEALRVA